MQPLQPDDPSQIAGYRILARLGAGGMGQVYLARSAGGRTVAIKVVRTELADESGFHERFRREVAAARRVSGPYTASVVDADPDAEIPWLATEYVAGPALASAVATYGPLPEPSMRALASGLAEALQAVHGAGLIHRDLKPSNVLLALDGPRLIDFGISRAADDTSLTSTGIVVGSPGYMSPEQADGLEIGPPSDLFSLASVLVFAATGQGPFGSGASPSLLYRIVHTPPDLDAVPDYLLPMVEGFFAKDPAQRPGTADLIGLAVPEGTTTEALTATGWLPPAITYAIARRSAELLNLESAPDTASVPPPDGPPDTPPAPESPPGEVPDGPPRHNPPPPAPSYAPTVSAPHPPPGPNGPPPSARVPAPPPATPPAAPPAWQLAPPPRLPVGPKKPAGQPSETPAARAAGLNRRRFLVGGAAATVAAAGGVTAWLLTRADAGGSPTSQSAGGPPTGSPGATAPAAGPVPGGASQGPTYKIGLQAALSGQSSDIGNGVRQGAELAVKRANDTGGNSFLVTLTTADDQGTAPTGQAAAQRLVNDDEVIAVIGPVFSSTFGSASPIYEQAGLPTVTPTATSPLLTDAGHKTFNRAVPTDAMQGAEIAAFLAHKLRVSSAHLVDDGSQVALDVLAPALEALTQAGVRVTGPETAQSPADDFADLAGRIKNSSVATVVYGGNANEGVRFARKLAEVGYTGIRLASELMLDQGFVDQAGAAADGWYFAASFADTRTGGGTPEFTSDYRRANGEDPPPFAVEGFDVANLIIATIRKLVDARTPVDRKAMLTAVRTASHQGAAKAYAFDPASGEFAGHGTFIYQVDGKNIDYVGAVAELTAE